MTSTYNATSKKLEPTTLDTIEDRPSSVPATDPPSESEGNESIATQLSDTHSEPHPIPTATGVYVTVHGHFYQPPRENPYLEAIERQPSAEPFRDWNERILYECYRPNAFARILNQQGQVIDIVNNFEYLSFNIGPTLMSWLQEQDGETYQRILEGDRRSAERLDGHGNAIAQVYNHIIMPLATPTDKYTQVRWGKAEFRQRFGREPEGMWLAETAVDQATLEVLYDEGIRFTILAPSQAQRCRPLPTSSEPDPEWHEVGGGQIDPTRPYRCYLDPPSTEKASRRSIDIFFYDGPISRDIGFNDILKSSHHLTGRIGAAIQGARRAAQIISVATDGETFGHHKKGGEKCMAYAFAYELGKQGWVVTNYAHYLSLNPPTWEVELKPVTAWSCFHGVDRWQDDCGCGGGGDWQQKWRRPLRESLNWLRDRAREVYLEAGRRYLKDPDCARDEYIQVILDRAPETLESFLKEHQSHPLTPSEQVDTLRLLEMQRHTLLMFTSCGWFFDEISRPEGVQILRYAMRVMELAGEVTGVQLESEFVRQLEAAPSNVETFGNGAEVYRQLVAPSKIELEQVAAHYAIRSLFDNYAQQERLYCYTVHQLDYQKQGMGSLNLAVGQLHLVSNITAESCHLVFAVLHLGGWDFHCCIKPFTSRLSYSQLKSDLFRVMQQASTARVILAMNDHFDGYFFGLQDIFAQERHRIMEWLNQETLSRLDRLYAQVYRDNFGVLVAFHRDGLPVPKELQVAAEIALSNRAVAAAAQLTTAREREEDERTFLAELEAIAQEARNLHCRLDIPQVKQTLEGTIQQLLWDLMVFDQPENWQRDAEEAIAQIEQVEQLIALGESLQLHLDLSRSQELYFAWLHRNFPASASVGEQQQVVRTNAEAIAAYCPLSCSTWSVSSHHAPTHNAQISAILADKLLDLGEKLAVDVRTFR